jgi:hypothetical protein
MQRIYKIAYIYTPSLSEDDIRSFVAALYEAGFSIDRLGKSDPPRKWNGTTAELVETVLQGTDLTNYTFMRDSIKRIGLTIQIHRDKRWSHDTISINSPTAFDLPQLILTLSKRLQPFISFSGVSEGGKDQDWDIIFLHEACPIEIRKVITKS